MPRRRTVPYLLQAVRQGLQDLGARDLPAARAALASGAQRVEARSSAAQVSCPHMTVVRVNAVGFKGLMRWHWPRGGTLVCRAGVTPIQECA